MSGKTYHPFFVYAVHTFPYVPRLAAPCSENNGYSGAV
jgi:hypothetical protein